MSTRLNHPVIRIFLNILMLSLPAEAEVPEHLTGEVASGDAAMLLYGEQPGDIYGSRVDATGDGDGDGHPDLATSAGRAGTDNHWASGNIYVHYQAPSGTHPVDNTADLVIRGAQSGDLAGWGMAWVDDVNGDGTDDLLVGSRYHDTAGPDAGAAYLFYMPQYGTISVDSADATFLGERAGDQAGRFVANGRDFNQDGFGDLVISAPYHDGADTDSGAVYLVYGPVYGEYSLATASVKLVGESEGDEAGHRVMVTDSAPPFIAVASQFNDRSHDDAGTIYILDPPLIGAQSLSQAATMLYGHQPMAQLGSGMAAADLNGDGLDELLVTTACSDRGNAASLHCPEDDPLLLAGQVHVLDRPGPGGHGLDLAWATIDGSLAGSFTGVHIAACDLDGNGNLELAVAAHHAGTQTHSGEVYLFSGSLEGSVSVSDADGIISGAAGDNLGQDLSCADLDGDGKDDLVIGAEEADEGPEQLTAGAVYLFPGSPDVPSHPSGTDTGDTTTTPPSQRQPTSGCTQLRGPAGPEFWLICLMLLARRPTGAERAPSSATG